MELGAAQQKKNIQNARDGGGAAAQPAQRRPPGKISEKSHSCDLI